MAYSEKKLKGWRYVLEVPDAQLSSEESPRRSSRISTNTQIASKILLTREEDGMELREGDCIVLDMDNESTDVAFIREIKFATFGFIEIIVMWFIRAKDTDYVSGDSGEKLENNEIFITAALDKVLLSDIIDQANVLSEKEFKQIVIDDSNRLNTFVCKRGCDSTGTVFSDSLDWRELHDYSKIGISEFVNEVRVRATPRAYASKNKTPMPMTPKRPHANKRKIVYDTTLDAEEKAWQSEDEQSYSDYDSADDAVNEEEGSSESSEVDDFSDEEFFDRNLTPGRKPYKKRKLTKFGKRTPSASPYTKKRTIDRPSLPSRSSPTSKKVRNVPKFDQSSFTEMKAKLHTSTRLNSLPCREDEFTELYLNLESSIATKIGCCVYVSGTPGVGKTATIREVIQQLKELVGSGDIEPFDYLEINGLKLISPQAAYELLWDKISGNRISASNAALMLEDHFQKKDSNRRPLVILMDELDQVVTRNQNVMYNFFNWPTYEHSKLIVIAVANTMDLPERVLTNKISSRLGLRRIQFIGYTFQQLGIIIKHRLDMIGKNKRNLSINSEAIEYAARKVASVSGDARRALTICRRAVEIAEQEFISEGNAKSEDLTGDSTFFVQIKHIIKAVNETTNSPIAQYLNSLSFATKVFLAAFLLRRRRSGLAECPLGDVIDEMKRILVMSTSGASNKVMTERNKTVIDVLYGDKKNIRICYFKNIINDLIDGGILLQQNSQGERNGLVNLNVSEEEISSVLKRDEEINSML